MANSPLQKSPIGLLQGYNLQTLGQAPIGFGDTVVPVAIADPWYLRDLVTIRTVSATVPIGASSSSIGLSVPLPEGAWVLYGLSANFTLAAADGGFSSELVLRSAIAGSAAAVGMAHELVQVAAGVVLGRFVEFWPPQPFIIRTGDRLEAALETSSVLTTSANFNLLALVAVLAPP